MGIIAVVTGILPFVTAISVPVGICGVVVSGLGLRRARQGAVGNYGMSIAGLVTSIIGLVFSVMWISVLYFHH